MASATAPDVARWGFLIGARGGVMADEFSLWVSVAAGRELIPVKSIERLVSDALLAEKVAKHANDEPLLSGESHDGAAEASFDLGFTYRGADPSSIRMAILKSRAAGRIVVLEAEGRGTIHDHDVLRGALTREDLGRLLADEWRIGLAESEGPPPRNRIEADGVRHGAVKRAPMDDDLLRQILTSLSQNPEAIGRHQGGRDASPVKIKARESWLQAGRTESQFKHAWDRLPKV